MASLIIWNYVVENLTFLLTLIVGGPIVAFCWLWKSIVSVFAMYQDLAPLQARDNFALVAFKNVIYNPGSKNFDLNEGISCILKGMVDGEDFFQKFVDKVINVDYPFANDHPHIRFHQNVKMFMGYWFLKTFRKALEYKDHMTVIFLPSGSSFEEEHSKWLKSLYDGSCPLWGILLVHRPSTMETYFAFKIHHVLADGYSLLHILDLLTNTKYKYQVRENNDTFWDKVVQVKRGFASSFGMIVDLWRTARPLYYEESSDNIFFTSTAIPLSALKQIRKKTGVRFASVMLYLLRNFIRDVLELLSPNEKDLPEKIIIANSLAWPKHPRIRLCNHATGLTFPFQRRNKDQSLTESLADVNAVFEGFQSNFVDKAIYASLEALSMFPAPTLATILKGQNCTSKISATYSHLIGSEKYEKVLQQHDCTDVNVYMVMPKRNELTFACLTTSNEVRVTITGPKNIFSSQEEAREFTERTFRRHLQKFHTY